MELIAADRVTTDTCKTIGGNKKMKRIWVRSFFGLVGVLLSMTFGAWWGFHHAEVKDQTSAKPVHSEQYDKIARAFEIIAGNYVEKVSSKQLTEGAIKGMLAELKDPYSVYMDKQASAQFEESLDASFQGIGAEVSDVDGKIVIVAPFKNSPSEKAGILSNDQIVSIDGKEVVGMAVTDVVKKIRGKKGTSVEIGILRTGSDKPILFEIKRGEIPLETVHSEMKTMNDKKIGYIEITQFSENTSEDFSKALGQLEAEKMQALIVDVRGNPGGLLSSVEGVLDKLITKKSPYIQIQDRKGNKESYFTKLSTKKAYPITVLIDQGSASAAEILAAAMSEAGGYQLIGEKSFGKGTVQQAVSLGDGSEIKMTFYKWLTPSGTWIHKKGIEPDVVVHQPEYFSLHPLHLDKTLAKNDNSEVVKLMQESLIANGFAPGRNDGYFDDQTEMAVKAFQRAENLTANGEVDEGTAKKMQDNIIDRIKDERNDLQLKAAMTILSK